MVFSRTSRQEMLFFSLRWKQWLFWKTKIEKFLFLQRQKSIAIFFKDLLSENRGFWGFFVMIFFEYFLKVFNDQKSFILFIWFFFQGPPGRKIWFFLLEKTTFFEPHFKGPSKQKSPNFKNICTKTWQVSEICFREPPGRGAFEK